MTLLLVSVLCAIMSTLALDNGLAMRPPMGFRTWNLFGANVTQELVEAVMDGMVSRQRTVDGIPTSLADLGYRDVGLDDNWQLCGSYGPEEYTFHSADGVYPVVDTARFPNLIAMTSKAHSLNLTAGWYMNNCICQDHCGSNVDFGEKDETCYRGDAAAIIDYGFDGVKLDGCSAQRDLDVWAKYLNDSLKPILIENCHWGKTVPNETWCPFHFYRASQDVRANYGSVLFNLNATHNFAINNLSRPGCWAYPDMLEVGCRDGPGGSFDSGLTHAEARTHFAAWAIVSSPLVLSMDINNDTIMDEYWSLIANPEIIAINQAWRGHSGSRFASAFETVSFEATHNTNYTAPVWQMLHKPVTSNATAVLLLNSDNSTQSLTLEFDLVPNSPCASSCHLRDIFSRTDIGVFAKNYTVQLPPHDAAFLLLESALALQPATRFSAHVAHKRRRQPDSEQEF